MERVAGERNAEHTWVSPQRGARMPADELRRRVLDTGLGILRETGLTVSFEHLRMEELIRAAGVPRSSVYRVWPDKEAFVADLIVELLQPTELQGAAFDPLTLEVARRVVDSHRHLLADAEGRRRLLHETIRQAAERNFHAVLGSITWKTYTVLAVTVPTLAEPHRERVLATLREAETHFVERMSEFYESLMPVFRMRLKPGITMRQFAIAGAAAVEGLAERHPVTPDLVDARVRLPGLDGEPVSWHLAAIAFLGVVDVMTEPE